MGKKNDNKKQSKNDITLLPGIWSLGFGWCFLQFVLQYKWYKMYFQNKSYQIQKLKGGGVR